MIEDFQALAQQMCRDAGEIWSDPVIRGRWIGRAVVALYNAKVNSEFPNGCWQEELAGDEYGDRFGMIP